MSKFINTKQNKLKSAVIYLTPLLVYAFSFCGEQILAADKKVVEAMSKSNSASAGTNQSQAQSQSNVQPVSSGVKLLEGIFQKLRNQPQLALGNNRAQNLLQAAGLAGSAGKSSSSATDQLLAIRPAERGAKGFRFDYAPNEYALDNASGRRAMRQAKMVAAVPPPAQVKPLAQSIQNFAGAAATLQAATNGDLPTVRNYGGYGQNQGQVIANAPMITEFHDTSMPKDSFQNVVAEKSRAMNSYGALKKSAASANAKSALSMAVPPKPIAVQQTINKGSLVSDGEPKIAYNPTPVLQAATNGTIGPQGLDATLVSSAAEPVAPASPGLFKNVREFSKQDKFSNSSGVKEMFGESRDAEKRKNQIAILPPSIVSGVPLVHLGASALQIKESLGAKVRIDKQNIEDWNVWSVFGKGKGECALQLYFKHGVVEAIRVFDASYLGVDLGVKLGSDLQTIKEKFGEPAFILPEPAGGRSIEAGKNYIYPISQVSFALARSRDRSKTAPQVVSMLIFNVK